MWRVCSVLMLMALQTLNKAFNRAAANHAAQGRTLTILQAAKVGTRITAPRSYQMSFEHTNTKHSKKCLENTAKGGT